MDTQVITFTAHDRCDARCNAQALAKAQREGFEELLFCMHHVRQHENALIDNGWTVHVDVKTYESYRSALDVSPV